MSTDAENHDRWLDEAIAAALAGVTAGHGGPFGALVVRAGRVLSLSCNRVTSSNDPTAHAEIVAIREACRKVGDFRLHGAVLYASCEPCPMCAGAAHWARIERVYYAATRHDAAAAGFDDAALHADLQAPPQARAVPALQRSNARALAPFQTWQNTAGRIDY